MNTDDEPVRAENILCFYFIVDKFSLHWQTIDQWTDLKRTFHLLHTLIGKQKHTFTCHQTYILSKKLENNLPNLT